jgi:hypothetical protein
MADKRESISRVTAQPKCLAAHRRWINPPAGVAKPAQAGWLQPSSDGFLTPAGGFNPRQRRTAEQLLSMEGYSRFYKEANEIAAMLSGLLK